MFDLRSVSAAMNGVDAEKAEAKEPTQPKAEDEDAIESDVQNLLEEMATTFKSFSETVFEKVDKLTGKIETLQKSVDVLPSSDSISPPQEHSPEETTAPSKE